MTHRIFFAYRERIYLICKKRIKGKKIDDSPGVIVQKTCDRCLFTIKHCHANTRPNYRTGRNERTKRTDTRSKH